jgi:hypothetical protein
MDDHRHASFQDTARGGRALGAMFFSVFGGAWLGLWAFRSFASPAAAGVVIALATAILIATAYRTYRAHAVALQADASTPASRKRSKLFHWINGAQWAVILVVGNVLANVGLADWIIPAAIFVIGVHFLPLARLFANPPHYVTGSALMLLAVVFPLTAPRGAADPVGCLGAGIILWSSAAWALRPVQRWVPASGL